MDFSVVEFLHGLFDRGPCPLAKISMTKFLILLLILQVSAFASSSEEATTLLNQYAHENDIVTRMENMSRNFIGLPSDQLLERMVELSLRTEEHL